MKKYILNYNKYISIIFLVIISIVTYNIGNKKYNTIFLNKDKKYISVYVKGNVKEEKTLKVKDKTTVQEVLNLCGGIKENSDISNIYLKSKVKNGDVIEVLVKNSGTEKYNEGNESKENNQNKVNINTADKNKLTTLDGIGQKTAEKIIEYRKENKFKRIEDVKNVSGIGEKKYEKIKNQITI